jgi:hypothetical protein
MSYVQYPVLKSPLLDSVLNHFNPVYILTSNLLNTQPLTFAPAYLTLRFYDQNSERTLVHYVSLLPQRLWIDQPNYIG